MLDGRAAPSELAVGYERLCMRPLQPGQNKLALIVSDGDIPPGVAAML